VIFTFYSYKGGVGRSMALANVASWFVLQGARVVMIDWDLEAPGLEAFFYQSEEELNAVRARAGLMDLLLEYRQQYASAARNLDAHDPAQSHRSAVATLEPIERWLYPIYTLRPLAERGPGLWLLPAGERHGRFAEYAESVHDFDWAEFYADYEAESFFEWLRQRLAPPFNQTEPAQQAYGDVVLIDSRTGITEMGGVCTQQLADVVVAFSAPNLQNLLGVETMARSFRRKEIVESRQGRPEVIIVPSRVDASELESRNRFESRLRQIEPEFLPPVLQSLKRSFWDLKIPYVPKFAYEEAVAVRSPTTGARVIDAQEMASAYRLLAATMVMLTPASHVLRSYAAQETNSLFQQKRVSLLWAGLTGTSLANIILRKFAAEAPEIDLWLQQHGRMVPVSDEPAASDLPTPSAFVFAITPEAVESEWIRHAYQQARRNGACVYGVYAAGLPSILPRWIRRVRMFEFNTEWHQLLQAVRGPCHALRVPFMVPELPASYVSRAPLLELLRSAVFTSSGAASAGPVIVRGIVGSGKSVLAAAFCRDPEVIDRFDDGILWVTLGERPQLRESFTQIYAALTAERPVFANEQDAAYELGTKLASLRCLIVLDDVWSPEDATALMQTGPSSTWLITSRVALLPSAPAVVMQPMSLEEAMQFLAGAFDFSYTPLSLRSVASELGGLPLALSLARNLLLERVKQGDSVDRASDQLLLRITRNGLDDFDSLRAALDATVSRLSDEARRRFHMMKSLAADQTVSISDAALLWGIEELDAESQMQKFVRLSLVHFDPSSRTLQIHPVIRSYLRTEDETRLAPREIGPRLTRTEIRLLAEEMQQLLADRQQFSALEPVVRKIDQRITEIQQALQQEQ
jgi:hypothetical protein